MKLFNTLNSAKRAWTNGTVAGKARTMPLSNILVAFLLATLVNPAMAQCLCNDGKTLVSGNSFFPYSNDYSCPSGPECISCTWADQCNDAAFIQIAFQAACCVPAASPTAPPAGASNADSDWYLELDGGVTWSESSFNMDGSLDITQKYKVAYRKGYIVTFFESDCSTSTTIPSYTPSFTVTNTSEPLYKWFTVTSTISETSVVDSDLWSVVAGGTQASIDFCVRVDLVDNNAISYNFHEQKLSVTIDLTQGFTVTGIDVNRDGATEEGTSSDTDFGLTVCKCDANDDCSAASLFQGDAMSICIKPPPTGNIQVATVKNMYYYQATAQGATPVFNASMVEGGTAANAVTQVTYNGGVAVVKTQLPSVLFTPSNIDKNLFGSGTVLIRFGNGQVRNLRFAIDNSVDHIGGSASRKMQDQTNETQTGFSFSIDLAPREMEEAPQADANNGVIIGGIVGLIAAVAIIVALVLAARRKKDDKTKKEAASSVSKGVSLPEVD